MSGHSHASNIKRKKDTEDAKRSKTFSKFSRLISIAAKEKGGDIESNPRLRKTIEDAKKANMPKDKIDKAIKKGTGEIEGEQIEEFLYEAYGPSGVAIIIEGITDNKNRAIGEIKQILNKHNAKLADKGSVRFMFEEKNGKWIPKYPFDVNDEKTRKQITTLTETLKDSDEVQEVYINLNYES